MSERERFLRDLDARLRLRGGRRADALAEIANHIEEGVARGALDDEVVARLGSPAELAARLNAVDRRLELRTHVGFAFAATALVVALGGLSSRVEPDRGTDLYEQLEGRMSRYEVVTVLGPPSRVFRKNARAECWAYDHRRSVRLCFGPRRGLSWFSYSDPDAGPPRAR